jgi:hypothetical protein
MLLAALHALGINAFSDNSQASMRTRGAIVYLSQVRHSDYGRDSLAWLQRSLKLLFKHYNERQRDDVLILHTGDFDEPTQQRVLRPYLGRPVRFHRLTEQYWHLPANLKGSNVSEWKGAQGVGYRHMIRLFTRMLWDLAAELGYEYVMRLDEESLLHSSIQYNLFEYMASNDLEYGYRQVAWESGHAGEGLCASS